MKSRGIHQTAQTTETKCLYALLVMSVAPEEKVRQATCSRSKTGDTFLWEPWNSWPRRAPDSTHLFILNLIAHVQQTETCGALYSILYHHLYPFWDTCYSSKDTIQNLAATTQKTIYALSQMHMYVDLISQSGLPQTIPHTKVGVTTNDIWRFTSSNCFLRNGLNWVLTWSFPKQYIKTLAITVVSYVPRLTSIHHDGEPP